MFYTLYGQTVDSKVPLDSFGIKRTNHHSLSDIIQLEYIYFSDVEFKEYINHQTQLNKEYGYYFIENIALFEVFNGKKIVIKYFNKIDNDLIHSLLNYPFAILFNQRRKYVIHASSVVFENKVFCFCGKTQSGKSSLASYLIKMGGSLISEDTCVFDFSESYPKIFPSYNFIKISDEVNKYKNINFFDPIIFKNKSSDRKGYILDSQQFFSKKTKVDYFIYLEWSSDSTNLKKLDNARSLSMLLSNEFASFSEYNASSNFKSASKLVNHAEHFLYKRKKDLKTLDQFINIFSKKFL